MNRKIEELRNMATVLLESEDSNEEARKRWGENVRDLLQELSIYHFELEHQNAALEASEHDLVESRAKYIELFEEAPVGYVVLDWEMNIKQANRTFDEMVVPDFPCNSAANGYKFNDLVCTEYQDAFHRFFKKLSNSRSILSVEIKIWNRYGQPHFVAITAGKRKAEDILFRLTVTDINIRKRMEIQLRDAQEETDESNRKKTLFLTDISHELRTPLATVSGFCEMLSESVSDQNIREQYIQPVQNAIQAMQILADEIQDVSLLKLGIFPLRNIDVDVAMICREQIILARHMAPDKEILLRYDLKNIPILSGDPIRLGTILHFLLRQAINNISKGEILLSGHYDEKDDGIGSLILDISGHQIFPIESNDTDQEDINAIISNCNGVGPFLTRQILKIMKGSITHTPDQLCLKFPFLKSLHKTIPEPVQENYKVPAVENESVICLLVDDVMMNLKVLAALMRKINCIPVLATSGKEALELLARTHVDLILSDLWMPEMNGMEFAMKVRQNREYDTIPIVAVTADVEMNQNFDMQYFIETLIKPVNLAMLKEKLIPVYEKDIKDGAN